MNIFDNRNCLYTTTINISRGENSSEIKIASKQGHPIFKGSESATWVCVSVPWGPFLHCTDAAALPILLENFDIYLMYTYTSHPQELMIKIYLINIWQYCTCQPPTKSPRYSLHTVLSRISSPTIHKFNQDIYIWRGKFYNFNLCGLWKVDIWEENFVSIWKCLQMMWMILFHSYLEASSSKMIMIRFWSYLEYNCVPILSLFMV